MTKYLGSLAICVFVLAVAACGTSSEPLTFGDSGADVASGDGRPATGNDAATTENDTSSGSSTDGAGSSDGTLADATMGGDGASSDDGSGSAGDGSPGAADGAIADSATSDGALCAAFGSACSYGSQCCSGLCDTTKATCASSIATCAPATDPCTANTDCCSGSCVSGQCGATQCLTIGAACPVQGNVCCTGNCNGGTCQPVAANPSCTTALNACTSNSQCCSQLCDSSGRCALGSSYCIQTNDVCYHANDCCGGICTAPNGQPVTGSNPGLCSQPSSGGVNCTAVDGTVCQGGSCGSCCSRLCAPYGPTGVNVCQPARGCRVEGDLCRSNADCCGATGSGVLGDGSVVCSNSVNGGDVGVCMTPGPTAEGGTCVPEGDVCHYNQSNYTCSISSARADCCGPQTPKWLACVLDPFGVPRCNAFTGVGGDGGIGCISPGQACSMSSECCGGVPCVPNASGQLVCASSACQQSGQSCTANADCCSGLPCISLPGSTQGTCTPVNPPPPPPPPPSDGGSSDSGSPSDAGANPDSGYSPDGGFACSLYGQSCTSLPCCPGTQCISGKCSSF